VNKVPANLRIFRKVALDRLSSPEQLDQMLRVTSARWWIGMLALCAMFGGAIAWGYLGSVTTKATGQGVVIRSGGVQDVATLGAGQVMEIRAAMGEHIQAGTVIATVAQPAMADRIHAAEGQIRDLEAQRRQLATVRASSGQLQIAALDRQRATLEGDIKDLELQAKLLREQVPVDQELLAKGLITRQQTIATLQRLAGLETNIQERRAQITQIESARFRAQNEGVDQDLQLGNSIADYRRQLQALQRELEEQSNVRSPYSGQVVEVKVAPGALVQSGTPILSLQADDIRLQALLYIPADKAKQIRSGMAAEISPASIKREEFGFIRGKVSFVPDYPATDAALMRVFENSPLVRSLESAGPVTEVQVEMETDPATPSGFRWSSPRGAPVQLSGGTMIEGEVITEDRPPITLVIPYLREKLGIR